MGFIGVWVECFFFSWDLVAWPTHHPQASGQGLRTGVSLGSSTVLNSFVVSRNALSNKLRMRLEMVWRRFSVHLELGKSVLLCCLVQQWEVKWFWDPIEGEYGTQVIG